MISLRSGLKAAVLYLHYTDTLKSRDARGMFVSMRDRSERIFLCHKSEPARCSLQPLPGGESHGRHSSGTSPFRLLICTRTRRRSRHALLQPASHRARNSLIHEQREGDGWLQKNQLGSGRVAGRCCSTPFWAGISEWFIGSVR